MADSMLKTRTRLRDRLLVIGQAWEAAFKVKSFRVKLYLAPAVFLIYAAITRPVSLYIEHRPGIRLDDRLLTFLPRFDWSMPVFVLLYASICIMLLAYLQRPGIILRVLEMHFYVAVFRQLCILLIALEPPKGIIVLRDIFLENSIYPTGIHMTKDLFFSGHVASIWIYFLCADKLYLKVFFGCATVLMAFMILSMRIHYSYDVYGALLFTSVLYRVYARIGERRSAPEALPDLVLAPEQMGDGSGRYLGD